MRGWRAAQAVGERVRARACGATGEAGRAGGVPASALRRPASPLVSPSTRRGGSGLERVSGRTTTAQASGRLSSCVQGSQRVSRCVDNSAGDVKTGVLARGRDSEGQGTSDGALSSFSPSHSLSWFDSELTGTARLEHGHPSNFRAERATAARPPPPATQPGALSPARAHPPEANAISAKNTQSHTRAQKPSLRSRAAVAVPCLLSSCAGVDLEIGSSQCAHNEAEPSKGTAVPLAVSVAGASSQRLRRSPCGVEVLRNCISLPTDAISAYALYERCQPRSICAHSWRKAAKNSDRRCREVSASAQRSKAPPSPLLCLFVLGWRAHPCARRKGERGGRAYLGELRRRTGRVVETERESSCCVRSEGVSVVAPPRREVDECLA